MISPSSMTPVIGSGLGVSFLFLLEVFEYLFFSFWWSPDSLSCDVGFRFEVLVDLLGGLRSRRALSSVDLLSSGVRFLDLRGDLFVLLSRFSRIGDLFRRLGSLGGLLEIGLFLHPLTGFRRSRSNRAIFSPGLRRLSLLISL